MTLLSQGLVDLPLMGARLTTAQLQFENMAN
jgi:hypothetical protein